ncbi:LOW QUALITY PROTEIN: hypothetical protein V2J09_018272 [Rumex salicifolius]
MSLSLRDRVLFLFSKLGHTVPKPPVIYYDNMGATSPSVNLVFHSIMKHIALAYHFVPDNAGLLELPMNQPMIKVAYDQLRARVKRSQKR